jgi:hypothetical protein
VLDSLVIIVFGQGKNNDRGTEKGRRRRLKRVRGPPLFDARKKKERAVLGSVEAFWWLFVFAVIFDDFGARA